MQDPNAPYQSVDQTSAIPVNQPGMYQQPMAQPYQGQPQPGVYQQPMNQPYQGQPGMYQQTTSQPYQGTYQPPMAQPVVTQPVVAQPVVASPVYGQPIAQPVVMPPTYGDGAYERNQEQQRKKLWIGIGIVIGVFVLVDIINFICTGTIVIWW